MHFTSALVAALSLASSTVAAPAAEATSAIQQFTLGLAYGTYAGRALVAVYNGTVDTRLLVFREGAGSPAHLSPNKKGEYHNLAFNIGDPKPFGAVLPDPGDGDGFVFNIDALYNFTQRSFGIGDDGILYAKLHSARNQFLTCPINIEGQQEVGLFFGNDNLNGSLPVGCEPATVEKL